MDLDLRPVFKPTRFKLVINPNGKTIEYNGQKYTKAFAPFDTYLYYDVDQAKLDQLFHAIVYCDEEGELRRPDYSYDAKGRNMCDVYEPLIPSKDGATITLYVQRIIED
ncbi:hypothetical protein [Butyrivibrio sp. MC2013]|uniref:hypothetical protein n=1 Tax=Butyrivibrio sp. MC2013 TaxID=1280686 RepID=UPI000409480B|nr:hypothetical protein [Butyrivibrio sp. MC2013]